jgi:AcrR family transcriptional regulator
MARSGARKTQQDRAAETRRQLLDATVECLTELGYAGTTTTEVQRRAGVSRGALLYHFPSKATLLVEAVGHLAELQGAELRERIEELPGDADRIEAGVSLLWESFSGPLFYVAMELWTAARTDPELREVLVREERALGREMRRFCRELFGAELAARERFDEALDMMLQFMRGAAMTAILRADAERVEADIDRLAALFERALRG